MFNDKGNVFMRLKILIHLLGHFKKEELEGEGKKILSFSTFLRQKGKFYCFEFIRSQTSATVGNHASSKVFTGL